MKPTEWQLDISKEQYMSIYAGLAPIEYAYIFETESETDVEYIEEYLRTKLWRMNNLYYVIDKVGELVQFRMNLAQHIKYAQQLRHPKTLVLKSRQRGISTGTLIDYNDDALFTPNLLVGMQSYGLEESAALLEKLGVIWDNLDPAIKGYMNLTKTKDNTKSMAYNNGSEVKVQTSFRGSTLHRLHVSELGKIANKDPKKAKELKTGTFQAIKAGNPVTVESTAEGQHNAMHTWWTEAEEIIGERSPKDFYPLFLTWVTDPDCQIYVEQHISSEDAEIIEKIEQEYGEYVDYPDFKLSDTQKWWLVAELRELGDDFFQEYPHTPEAAFSAVRDGTYYAKHWRKYGHTKKGLYDPALDVWTAWDLGRNDMMVIIMFQRYQNEMRIVDCYYNHGEGLEHYTSVLKKLVKEKGYRFCRHILPHDVMVADLTTDVTRLDRLRELGLKKMKVLPRTANRNNDIEIVRAQIPNMWVDPDTCSYILKMFSRYTKKWDDVLNVFKDEPLHNTWSNPADSVRYGVLGSYKRSDIAGKKRKRPRRTRGTAL